MISKRGREEKGLKRTESEILKRLKETHQKQQSAINQILSITVPS